MNAKELAHEILNTCIDCVNEELDYGRAAKLISDTFDASLKEHNERCFCPICGEAAEHTAAREDWEKALGDEIIANVIVMIQTDRGDVGVLEALRSRDRRIRLEEAEKVHDEKFRLRGAYSHKCDMFWPECRRLAELRAPVPAERAGDVECPKCSGIGERGWLKECPDCHGTGKQRADAEGRASK